MLIKNIILLAFFTTSLLALQKEDIPSVMENRINSSIGIIAQEELSVKEKSKKIFPLFEDIFDYELMTKLSVGKLNWSKMTPEQRAEFTEKFVLHLKNSYVSKISLYTDEKLNIVKLEEVNTKRTWLLTKLIGTKDTYDITYKFYKSKNNDWLIYDVDIIGISLIQIYRAQFNNILQKESYATLLGKIETK